MSKLLILAYFLASSAIAATPAVTFPLKISRYAFTGEHFMLKDMDSKKLFEKLLMDGHLQFKTFHPAKRIPFSDFDWGSKVQIGQDEYIFSFPTKEELHAFAKDEITDLTPYNFSGGELSYGLIISLRDHAVKSSDLPLIRILLDKKKSPRYAGSANAQKEEIYRPLQQALEKLESKAKNSL